jgi:hypothetical protein
MIRVDLNVKARTHEAAMRIAFLKTCPWSRRSCLYDFVSPEPFLATLTCLTPPVG